MKTKNPYETKLIYVPQKITVNGWPQTKHVQVQSDCLVVGNFMITNIKNCWHLYIVSHGLPMVFRAKTKALALKVLDYLKDTPIPTILSRNDDGHNYPYYIDKDCWDFEKFMQGYDYLKENSSESGLINPEAFGLSKPAIKKPATHGYTFYVEFPSKEAKRKGTKKNGYEGHSGNCLAIWGNLSDGWIGQDGVLMREGLMALTYEPNSVVCWSSAGVGYLDEKCKRVSVDVARKIHPELLARIEN